MALLQGNNRFEKRFDPTLRTWINYLTPLVTPPVPPNTETVRAPVFSPIIKAAWIAAVLVQALPSLNTTTLAEQGPPPTPTIQQTDWPNPQGPKRANPFHIHNAQIQLIGQDLFFGAPGQTRTYDYPNPRGPAHGISLRTYTHNAQVGLIGQDALPFRQLDWQNPLAKRKPQDFIGLNSSQTLTPAAPVQDPFKPIEFANPQQPRRRQDYNLRAQTQLIGQDAFPARQRDWQTPRSIRRISDFVGENLLQTTLAQAAPVQAPFKPVIFDNRLGPRRRPQQHIHNAQIQLIGQGAPVSPGWVIERLTPAADGVRVTFSISREPFPGTELVFFPATPNERVAGTPIDRMQYVRDGTTITFGLPPAASRQPFIRYYWE